MKNYYRILNVGQDASLDEIKRSYHILAKRYHPDVNKGDRAASRHFDDIREAYTILSDDDARSEYNAKLEKESVSKITASDLSDIDNLIARRARENELKLQEIQLKAKLAQESQAQAQAQIAQMRDKIYKEGYERGVKEGHAIADKDMMRINEDMKVLVAENVKLKQRSAAFSGDRTDLEKELFERDRELNEKTERIAELETQLEWVRSATKGTDSLLSQLDLTSRNATALAEKIGSPAFALGGLSPELLNRRNRMQSQIDNLNKQIEALAGELKNLNYQSEQKLKLTENDKLLTAMENRAAEWAKKVKADRKLAKPTLYGTLGVLIWATEAEIKAAYSKLYGRYIGKTDADSVARLQKITEAYEILANPEKRKQYNASIGCPEDRIALEQRLIRENQAAKEEYRKKLAGREFWVYFDELSSLALAGDADAQNALGELYYRGEGIERDYFQAVYWFRTAFDQKHPAATYNLGQCYMNGQGIATNEAIGEAMLRQAANLGYPTKQE